MSSANLQLVLALIGGFASIGAGLAALYFFRKERAGAQRERERQARLARLPETLNNLLGNRYKVLSKEDAFAAGGDPLNLGAIPDIIIYDMVTKHFTLVEVKGSPNIELTSATATIITRIKASSFYQGLSPDLVLASPSFIPDEVQDELDKEKVEIVNFEDSDDLATKLRSYLERDRSTRRFAVEFPEAWTNRGMILNQMGWYPEAIDAFEEALSRRPELSEVWAKKGASLVRLGRYPEAVGALDKALELRSGLPEVWAKKGVALAHMDRHQAALSALNEAINLRHDFPEAWINKSYVLANLGLYEEASAAIDVASELEPDSPEVLNNEAMILCLLGRYEDAVYASEKALELDPKLAEAWNNKAWALSNLDRFGEAFSASEEAIRLDQETPEFWDTNSRALNGLGRYSEALEASKKALQFNPDYVDAWGNSGVALAGLGQNTEAVQWLCRAWAKRNLLSDRGSSVLEAFRELGRDPKECEP